MNKSQGHGDHIGTIMEPQDYLKNYIQDAMKSSKVGEVADIVIPFDSLLAANRKVVSLNYGDSDLAMRSIIISVPENNQNAFASCFPVLESKHIVPLTIEKVEEWDGEYEASITAHTEWDFNIHFFPTDYFAHKQDYIVGKKLNIALSAFAYSAKETDHGFDFIGQQAIDFLAKLGEKPNRDEDGNIKPVHFDTSKLVTYLPGDEYPEDAQIQSPVTNIESCHFLDTDFYLCDMTVHRPAMDGDIDIPARLCIRKDLLKGVSLKDGTPVMGVIWLQGCIK